MNLNDRIALVNGKEIRDQSPLGRVATPEEVAHTVLFLSAPGSEWLTGGVVDRNGAIMMAGRVTILARLLVLRVKKPSQSPFLN